MARVNLAFEETPSASLTAAKIPNNNIAARKGQGPSAELAAPTHSSSIGPSNNAKLRPIQADIKLAVAWN